MQTSAQERRFTVAPGRLTETTVQLMADAIVKGSLREDVRRWAQRELRTARVPERNNWAEACALGEGVSRVVPYRFDPALIERVSYAHVSLGLAGNEPDGEDCDGLTIAHGGACGAMGLWPIYLVCVFDGRGNGHVYGMVTCKRGPGPACTGPQAFDLVARKDGKPYGFGPLGVVNKIYRVDRDGQDGGKAVLVHQFARQRAGGSGPMGNWDLYPDVRELGAELEAARGYGLADYPAGALMLAPQLGDVGSSLAFLGAGPFGAYYGDSDGGVWLERPLDGFWSSLKKGVSSVGRAVSAGASVLQKVAKPLSPALNFIPGASTITAGIAAVDRASRLARQAVSTAQSVARTAANPSQQLMRMAQSATPALVRQLPGAAALGPAFMRYARSPNGIAQAQSLFAAQRPAARQLVRGFRSWGASAGSRLGRLA